VEDFPALKYACQPGQHVFMPNSSEAEKPDHSKPFLKNENLVYKRASLLKIDKNVNSKISIM